jgi:hypothetical protein
MESGCGDVMKQIIIIYILLLIVAPVAIGNVIGDDNAVQTVTVLAPPSVDKIEITPDNDSVTPGVQVINLDWETQNKTVTITATVTDMEGWDDLTGTPTAVITGPSPVNDSPVSLAFDHNTSLTTAVYNGSFNMSTHAEGDYTVNVTAYDAGGLSDSGYENFTYLHMLPNEVVTTYNFTTGAGKDKWAFKKQHFDKPPLDNSDPDNKFKPENYERIEVDDGTMQEDATGGKGFYAIHRFRFNIAEPEDAITRIDILWDGKATHDWGTDGATLYIWNFTTGAYEQLDSSEDDYITLEGSITANIGNYISPDGNLIFIAEQNTAQWKFLRWSYHSRLGTDYVKVDVTSTPEPEVIS